MLYLSPFLLSPVCSFLYRSPTVQFNFLELKLSNFNCNFHLFSSRLNMPSIPEWITATATAGLLICAIVTLNGPVKNLQKLFRSSDTRRLDSLVERVNDLEETRRSELGSRIEVLEKRNGELEKKVIEQEKEIKDAKAQARDSKILVTTIIKSFEGQRRPQNRAA